METDIGVYHVDKNITCKGKGWNGEVHRMKKIGVMKKKSKTE